ncbi:apicoplast pyruvate carrier 1 [Lepeophtheirus salmonis]|uniref:apicoplast pyruvate carrier 1 n=1 Tax=Lepeophtheirus salmonis TaxID=72036 RepID=UPI001AE83D13|nr:L-lactate transporter-like [Lepeophtheirus salmonis]
MKCPFSCIELNKEWKKKTIYGIPIFGLISLFGGILVMIVLGSYYSFGNIMTYMTSYMRQNGSPNITYSDFIVVQSTYGMTQGITMPVIGYITLKIGENVSILIGTIVFSLGCIVTHITIQKELWMVAATYGFISSLGQNLALIPTITTAMKWFPKHKALISGVIVSGYGGGSFIFNQIQTNYINPENFLIESSGQDYGYFTNPILLNRLPQLILLLGGIYFFMSLLGALLIVQPCEEWYNDIDQNIDNNTIYESWIDILKSKELYLLWISRFALQFFSQVIGGFYKTFGLTFIYDDHFLSMVGTVCSIFNCSGRLFYGYLMDKLSYKVAASIEAIVLTVFTATLYFTSLLGEQTSSQRCMEISKNETHFINSTITETSIDPELCGSLETPLAAKITFAIFIWVLFFTFPGTYAMQPAVCTQTFGQKYGGMAYSLLFTGDILNNLMVGMLSKPLIESTGFLGLFLCTSAWGIVVLIATQFYPKYPSPYKNNTPNMDMTKSSLSS